MKLPDLKVKGTTLVNVIIETPAGSSIKYKYISSHDYFKVNKVMPEGFTFPADFGFFPQTIGEDGDALDAFVLNDCPAMMGSIIECRLIGVITAEQKDPGTDFVRNDRFVAVADCSKKYANIQSIKDLDEQKLNAITDFFKYYNAAQGREFEVLQIKDNVDAEKILVKGVNQT